MSLKDLREAGVLLPEEEWGRHDIHASVNKFELAASMLFGLAAVIVTYIGGGKTLTLVGGIMFMGFMGWITYISVKAIDKQVGHLQEEREVIRQEDAAAGGAEEGEQEEK